MTIVEPKIRNDGKPARRSRLGSQPNSLALTLKGDPDEALPMWHEIVSPGPKGDVDKAIARAEAKLPAGKFEAIPPAPRNPVRAGKFSPRTSPRVLQQFPYQRVRPMKGSRTSGFVEVCVGNSRARMAAVRTRPIKRVSA